MCVFSVGCATTHQQKKANLNHPSQKANKSLLVLDEKNRVREEELQDKRDKSRLLKRKGEMGNISLQASPQKIRSGRAVQLAPILDRNLSETQLFGEIFNRFERNDELGFYARKSLFIKKFPNSARADEVFYLSGMMAFSSKDYGSALRDFNQVIKQYPYSNKKPAALFAKGAVLRKMDMAPLAKNAFAKVVTQYPGSPEALRAQNELRTIK